MGNQAEAQFRLGTAKACSGHGARPRQPGYRFSVFSGLCFPCPGRDGEEGCTCSWVGPPSPWQHVARAEPRGLSCRGQSLRLGGGPGTWSWQVRLGTLGVREAGRLKLGKVRHSPKEKRFVCGVPTGRVGSPTGATGNPHPSLYFTTLGPGWGPTLSSWVSESAPSPANPKETLGLVWIRLPFVTKCQNTKS